MKPIENKVILHEDIERYRSDSVFVLAYTPTPRDVLDLQQRISEYQIRINDTNKTFRDKFSVFEDINLCEEDSIDDFYSRFQDHYTKFSTLELLQILERRSKDI